METFSVEFTTFDVRPCPVYGAPFSEILGTLADRVHYRCSACGADYSGADVSATRDAVRRATEISEILDGGKK